MRILIVDDNELVRRGVRELLSPQATWEVCGEAVDGRDAMQKSCELQPDLILLDISMPDLNGLEVARLLRQEVPHAKVVVMSQHDPSQLLPRAVEAGALTCVDKGHLVQDLVMVVKGIEGMQAAPPLHAAANVPA